MAQQEQRTLKMHPRLLWDVIHRQAGTLSKAILEGVMNSVDAGATFCDITIDRETFSIVDDGKGFQSDEEIDKFFETFGYPHKEGDATYGRFRMGRGQMMAFGHNLWTTNSYKMEVDLKPQEDELGEERALGYVLTKLDNPEHKGCSVQVRLYESLTPSILDATIREVSDYVKFVNIPVRLNGKQISTDPKKFNWDEETEHAYIKRKESGSLDIYNQGVLVCKYGSYKYGVSGIIASKTALQVNFARNDVQASCPVFKAIVKKLKADSMEAVDKKTPLDDNKREYFARSLVSGESSIRDLKNARIITDVTNSHHSFDIFARLGNYDNRISIAPRGDRVGEVAHTRKLAFVVSTTCAERFNASTPEELVATINDIRRQNGLDLITAEPFPYEEFSEIISSTHEPLKDSELNKAERLVLKVLRAGNKTLHYSGLWADQRWGRDVFDQSSNKANTRHRWVPGSPPRKVSVGVSDTADAWTDGQHNIWINRNNLRLAREGAAGLHKLASILLHEYLHNGPDTGTHEHGVEFYERFHDLTVDGNLIPDAVETMMACMVKELRNDNKNVPAKLRRLEDNTAVLADAGIKPTHLINGDDVVETDDSPSSEEPVAPTSNVSAKTSRAAKPSKAISDVDKDPQTPQLSFKL